VYAGNKKVKKRKEEFSYDNMWQCDPTYTAMVMAAWNAQVKLDPLANGSLRNAEIFYAHMGS
jgi:hypothetical protein